MVRSSVGVCVGYCVLYILYPLSILYMLHTTGVKGQFEFIFAYVDCFRFAVLFAVLGFTFDFGRTSPACLDASRAIQCETQGPPVQLVCSYVLAGLC